MNPAATVSAARPLRRRHRPWLLPAVVLFALALAARITGAWWYANSSNPDYGVVVLMARNLARGIDFPVFFYGQPYMGSLEPLVSAALVRLFGASPFVICLGTALVAFGVVATLFRLAWRVAGPWAALLAAALCLVGPPGFFHYMVSPRGGYALGLLLTILLLHEGLFPDAQAETVPGRHVTPGRLAVVGLLGGLGFWNFWLTLPALGAAGLMLAARLKGRIFSWRVWLPALAGFVAGSLPWWIWNARHDWASLTSAPASSGLRASAASLANLLMHRLPDLIGTVDFLPPGGARLAVHLLVIYLAVLPLAALVMERREPATAPMRRLAAGVLLYGFLFTLAYTLSSFGALPTSRYLLPLVPTFAVWAGCGVARCFACASVRGGPRRGVALVLAVPGAITLGLLVAASAWTLKAHAARPREWIPSARQLMDHPGAGEALFAKFDLFGINWATDGRVCAVSPEIWRYAPYLDRLEAARSPGVLENMGGFDHFLEQTRARASYERVGRYRLHHHAVPPPLRPAVLPATAIAEITDGFGGEWTRELTDDSGETHACLAASGPGGECRLRVRFREPVEVSGVRLVPRGHRDIFSWSVEGLGPDGARHPVSRHLVHSGYYWSGPRFYHGGLAARAELRIEPATVSGVEIRLTLLGRQNWKCIETLQILTGGEPPPPVDFAAAAAAVKSAGVARVFADRWTANELARELGSAVWISREPALTGEDPLWSVTVPVAETSGVIVDPGEAAHTRGVLERAGIAADASPAGGLVLFHLRAPRGRGDDEPVLAFYAGQLFCNRPPEPRRLTEPFEASYLGGKICLLGISQWRETRGPETATVIALDWRVAPEGVPRPMVLFMHGLDGKGRIACMLNEPLALDAGWGPAPWGRVCTTIHTLRPGPETPNGTYTLVAGLFRPGLITRRLIPDTTRETNARRLVLPRPLTVQRQTPPSQH